MRARAAAAFALALAALASPRARADEPSASCQAHLAGGRALVSVTLGGFLDPELLRLVRLGLDGRLRVSAIVYRDRGLWFDAREGEQQRSARLSFARARGRFLLDGREVEPRRPIALEPLSVWLDRAPRAGERHHVDLEVRLEVVTTQSLGRVATWIADPEDRRDRAPGLLSRNLLATVAGDLERVGAATCTAALRAPAPLPGSR